MSKYFIIIILILLVAGAVFLAAKSDKNATVNNTAPADQSPQNSETVNTPAAPMKNILNIPLEKAAERITKKPFGIFITPQNSPVQPERFFGYHTGTDFEIFPGEENQEVSVFAVCDGKIIYRDAVSGYGGVIIQSCAINTETTTVLYGHISLANLWRKSILAIKKANKLRFWDKDLARKQAGKESICTWESTKARK